MYTIRCVLGHERQDVRPRGSCLECGNEMTIKKERKKVEKEKPQEEKNG